MLLVSAHIHAAKLQQKNGSTMLKNHKTFVKCRAAGLNEVTNDEGTNYFRGGLDDLLRFFYDLPSGVKRSNE